MVLRASYAFVAAVLLVHWAFLSQYMVDVPYADDWRLLRPGPHALPAQFDLAWIFRSSNNTVYATSKLIDYLYFTYTTGSYIFYQQVTSLLVLGGCIAMSVRLLSRLGLSLPWHVLGVLATVYLLQARSYWGIASLAYQQALPVVGMLGALVLVTAPRWSAWRASLLALVVLAAGLAYVSGAVAMTALGAYLVALALLLRKEAHAQGLLVRAGVVLACGAGSLLLQWWLIDDLVSRGMKVATPLDWQFWHFAFHQVARALGDFSADSSSALRAAFLTALLFGTTGVAVVRSALRPRGDGARDQSFAIAAGGVLVCVAVYLAVVSFGRASFPHPVSVPAELAGISKGRFHYWWVTALIPWAAIAPAFIVRSDPTTSGGGRAAWERWVFPAVVASALIAVQSRAQWDFDAYYASRADQRMVGLQCLLRGYRTPGPIRCETLVWRNKLNLRPHLMVARLRSLHFSYIFEAPPPATPTEGKPSQEGNPRSLERPNPGP